MFSSHKRIDDLEKKVDELEKKVEILTQQNEFLVNNDVSLKQELDELHNKGKTQYFG